MNFKNLVLIIAITLFIFSCNVIGISGSGTITTGVYELSGFDQIDISGAYNVTITQSSDYNVSITTDDNLFEYLDIKVSGSTLSLSVKPMTNINPTQLTAEISLPAFYVLNISGASSADFSDFSASDVEFDISGASSANATNSNFTNATIDVSGASCFVSTGLTITSLTNADISGSSTLDLTYAQVGSADLKISGASLAYINMDGSGSLTADVSGASTLIYYGTPTDTDFETLGASTITNN